jgi:hypothetical protein
MHTALLIYPYGPWTIFIRPCHTDQLDYLINVLRTGCFCIGPGIDSRSAVLNLCPTGLGANTANLESIPGPIQKQPVSNTLLQTVIYKLSDTNLPYIKYRKDVFVVLYGMFCVNKEDMWRIRIHFVLAFHIEISCLQMQRLSAWYQVLCVVWTTLQLLAQATCSAVYTSLDLIQTAATIYT